MADENPQTPQSTAPPAQQQTPAPAQGREFPRRGGKPISGSQRPTGGDKAFAASGKKQYFRRRKVCRFCVDKIDDINYKDVRLLSAFISERGKIVPRRISGVCAPHQRRLSDSIKQARNIALLPFAGTA